MSPIDYEQLRTFLLGTGDAQVKKVVVRLDLVYRSSTKRPHELAPSDEAIVAGDVNRLFPKPFTLKFGEWAAHDVKFFEALDDPAAASTEFNTAFSAIYDCWRQIVHFVPFIFMQALSRLEDESIVRWAAPELANVLAHYESFYSSAKSDDARLDVRKESDQRDLLTALLDVYRQLQKHDALGAGVALPLIPERFDESLRLLQQVRNRVAHGNLHNRSPRILEPIYRLTRAAFLDALAMLAPLCRDFSMVFVLSTTAGAERVDVKALDFSGADGPRLVTYRASTEVYASGDSFLDGKLYLVRRDTALEPGKPEHELVREDYLNMTPFLIVQAQQALARIQGEQERKLFALDEYQQQLQYLRFLELSGGADTTIPEGADDPKLPRERLSAPERLRAHDLLADIGEFVDRAKALTDLVPKKAKRRVDDDFLRTKCWDVSREPLGVVLDVERYDEWGRARDDMPVRDAKRTYTEELYVAPAEWADVEAFLASTSRGLVLAGGSGSGKSNLLCNAYLRTLRDDRPAVFFTGRQFASPSFQEALRTRLVQRLDPEWTLDDLDAYLARRGKSLTIFFDAVNEYSGPQGAIALLTDVIATVQDRVLRQCSVACTVRTETWEQYKEQVKRERPLDPATFYAPGADAVVVRAFDDETKRAALFEKYRTFYVLTPERYEALSPAVRDLAKQPFMMSMIANAYAGRTISRDLDYFSIFQRLTERKIDDAKVLITISDEIERESLPGRILDCLRMLAELMYERLTSQSATAANGDALPIDAINKDERFNAFRRRSPDELGVIDVVRQVGLVERVSTVQRGFGGARPQAAYAFFHDQYTQFCLAMAYQSGILGEPAPSVLRSPNALGALAAKIVELLGQSVRAPVLAGAIDHWVHYNMAEEYGGKVAPLVPLFDRLADSDAPAARYYVSAMLAGFVAKGILRPADLYGAVFEKGSPTLQYDLAGAFAESWPGVSPDAVAAFIEASNPDDEPALRLADVFAVHFSSQPEAVVEFLDRVILGFSLENATQARRLYKQLRFTLEFATLAMVSRFDDPNRLRLLRDFVRSRYQPVIDVAIGTRRSFTFGELSKAGFRALVATFVERFGIAQWKQFVGSMEMSANNLFFVDNEGVNQRAVMEEFLPYSVALHNGARPSFQPGSPFRELVMRMLTYRVTSNIGYNAMVGLPTLLKDDWDGAAGFVYELIASRGLSAQFFGSLLVTNLAYTDESLAPRCLELFEKRIVPFVIAQDLRLDWPMLQTLCVGALDVEHLWPSSERILGQFFAHYTAKGDAAACSAFGDDLFKASFYDLEMGQRVIDFVLRSGLHEQPLWRDCVMKVFAAMYVRDRGTLRGVLESHNVDESELRAARGYISDYIITQSRRSEFQVKFNRFIAFSVAHETKLRYLATKYIVGGLAISKSVEDFAKSFRVFFIKAIEAYLGEDVDESRYLHLTVEDCIRDSPVKRRSGAGEVYTEHARA